MRLAGQRPEVHVPARRFRSVDGRTADHAAPDHRPHWFPKSLDSSEILRVDGGTVYCRHSDLIRVGNTNVSWVLASGVCGKATLSVDVSRMPPETAYAVRLHFAELEDVGPGERVFDVVVAGQEMLARFDVVSAAGGLRASVVKECVVRATDKLKVELVPVKGEPILSGTEIALLADN